MKVPTHQTIEEFIRGDAHDIFEKVGRLPRLAYMVNPRDAAAMLARLPFVGGSQIDDGQPTWFEMHTEAGYVRIVPDPNHPTGAAHRFIICKCGGLSLYRPGVDLCLNCWTPKPYAPGEKMTDRHPDSVIAQVVEETIEKLPGGGSSTFTTPWVKAGDLPCASHPRPVQNGVFHIEPDPPDLAQRQAARVAEHQRREQRGPFDYDAPDYSGILKASYEQPARPDGFAQHQVDAAKAALLAPAPPRYPRPR